jgi:hypothetical protein
MAYHVSRSSILLGEHKLKHNLPFCLCQSAINTVQFTGRTGALAILVAGVGSASGGFITEHLLDRKNLSRRKCGIVGLVFVSAIIWITWIGGVVNQTKVLGRLLNSYFKTLTDTCCVAVREAQPRTCYRLDGQSSWSATRIPPRFGTG